METTFFDLIQDDTCSTVGLAARSGNLSALREMLEIDDSSHEISDNRGWFPIHEAASRGNSECVIYLLKRENNHIDDQTYEGETPLFLAVKEGHLSVIQTLLSEGANISVCNNEDVSVLTVAVENGDLNCVELLLKHGIDINTMDAGGWTALHEAAYNGNLPCVSTLLSYGAPIDVQNSDGATALFTAAQYGYLECAELLVSQQADINLVTIDGATPLFIAAQQGYSVLLKSLLDAGADPKIVTDDGSSPLHAAGEHDHVSCVKVLLKADVDPEVKTHDGTTVLHLAAQEGHIQCVEELLSYSVSVDVPLPGNRMTPLCLASRGQTKCCKILLKAGADPNHEYEDVDLLPKTPLMTSIEDDYAGCTQVLLECGADVNKATYTSPLIMAAQFSSTKSLKLLLEHGVEVNYVDRGRNSALSLAITRLGYSLSSQEPNQQLECIKLLLKAGSTVNSLFSESPCMAFHDPSAPINPDVVKLLLDFVTSSREIQKICYEHQSEIKWQELIRLINSPRSLQHLCRFAIRQKLGYKRLMKIDVLPLPHCLKSFVKYSYL